MNETDKKQDMDIQKGTVEETRPERRSGNQSSFAGQLPHRTEDAMIKENDSDFPEPGSNPEHSGEREESTDR